MLIRNYVITTWGNNWEWVLHSNNIFQSMQRNDSDWYVLNPPAPVYIDFKIDKYQPYLMPKNLKWFVLKYVKQINSSSV